MADWGFQIVVVAAGVLEKPVFLKFSKEISFLYTDVIDQLSFQTFEVI